MENFTYYNPVKLHFGKDQIKMLREEIPQYGKKVLLVYGGGSIKKNGVYDAVMEELSAMDAEVTELAGVEPNPRAATAQKGADLCKEHDIDFVLAVGGGSVIDCSKTIIAGAKYDGPVWDLVTKKAVPEDALPLGTVLTIAATGSEMNAGAVITNWETQEKYGWGAAPLTYPKFSILDPVYTYSLPEDQTVYGMVDMMTHVFEQYYTDSPNAPLQDRLCESVLKTVIETAPKVLEEPENYEYRETILYNGTVALNGMLQMGTTGDWATHNLEHAVSAVYDIPHAGGLAILFPNWQKHTLDKGLAKTKRLAVEVFDVDPEGKSDKEVALEGIEALRNFWTTIGAPKTLADYDIDDEKIDLIADKAMSNGPFGGYYQMQKDDVLSVLKMSL